MGRPGPTERQDSVGEHGGLRAREDEVLGGRPRERKIKDVGRWKGRDLERSAYDVATVGRQQVGLYGARVRSE